jgi:uncharacterized RDD family membrane protein YckC
VSYAGAVTRLAAYLVDLVVLSAVTTVGSAAAAYILAVVTGYHLGLADDRDIAGLGLALWWLAYFSGSWALAGRTPGMALLGLRVVRPDGTPVGPLGALLRAATFPLSVAVLGLGFAGIVLHPQRRALHDLLASTAVVYAGEWPSAVSPEPALSRRTPPAPRPRRARRPAPR